MLLLQYSRRVSGMIYILLSTLFFVMSLVVSYRNHLVACCNRFKAFRKLINLIETYSKKSVGLCLKMWIIELIFNSLNLSSFNNFNDLNSWSFFVVSDRTINCDGRTRRCLWDVLRFSWRLDAVSQSIGYRPTSFLFCTCLVHCQWWCHRNSGNEYEPNFNDRYSQDHSFIML